ncbi:conjugal transfer protein TrbF [Duganella ginsengisoli]|uniref:Conjugal transfer protein TrbF n=2 Tax=Pseudoduganella ginsengisoli TaxID=1462440 RepID=A0A6L6Q8W8_9BURK|nr:conjugal transfer protein TrbF [Pseudoduganella ginsengisoli]
MEKLDTANPYLNARRSWNSIFGGIVSLSQFSQLIALGCILIAIAAVGGLYNIGSQSKFIPLVVMQDANHKVVSVTRADRVASVETGDFEALAASFIENVRLVTPDVQLQRKAILKAYCVLNAQDAATQKVNEYLNGKEENRPFKRAATETVSTEVTSVLKETDLSYQVEWVEHIRDRQGGKKGDLEMRALVTMYQGSPNIRDNQTPEENALCNPRALYVKDFNWTKKNGL